MRNLIKSFILITATGFITPNSTAQKTKDIPQALLTAFSAKYPQAQLKRWKTNKSNYVTLFTLDKNKHEAYWSKNGNWISTEIFIKHSAGLPAEAYAYLKKGVYASWHIDEIKNVRTPAQNIYQVYLDNHSGSPLRYEDAGSANDMMLCFDTNGKLIKAVENN